MQFLTSEIYTYFSKDKLVIWSIFVVLLFRLLLFLYSIILSLFQDEEEEIPLDLEEVEAVSKKARQDEEIHSEHMQVCLLSRLDLT